MQLYWVVVDEIIVDLMKFYISVFVYCYQYLVYFLLSKGVIIVGVSDWLVFSLLLWKVIQQVVICKGLQGVFNVGECLDCQIMFYVYICNVVWIIGLEYWIGSLELGKQVDFIVFDCDVFEVLEM